MMFAASPHHPLAKDMPFISSPLSLGKQVIFHGCAIACRSNPNRLRLGLFRSWQPCPRTSVQSFRPRLVTFAPSSTLLVNSSAGVWFLYIELPAFLNRVVLCPLNDSPPLEFFVGRPLRPIRFKAPLPDPLKPSSCQPGHRQQFARGHIAARCDRSNAAARVVPQSGTNPTGAGLKRSALYQTFPSKVQQEAE